MLSDSACTTRTSLAPWITSSGVRIWSTFVIGERASMSANCSGSSGSPTNRCQLLARCGRAIVGQRPHEVGQARDADVVDRRGEDVRGERDADQRRVAAVGAAEDRDAVRIGVALLDGPVHPVDQVVVHLAGELADRRLDEGLAVSGGSAEVDLQHRISAVGQQLHAGVVHPSVAGPRTAVHRQHQRQVRSAPPRPAASGTSAGPDRRATVIVTGSIGASCSGSRCGNGRNSSRLSPVSWS